MQNVKSRVRNFAPAFFVRLSTARSGGFLLPILQDEKNIFSIAVNMLFL